MFPIHILLTSPEARINGSWVPFPTGLCLLFWIGQTMKETYYGEKNPPTTVVALRLRAQILAQSRTSSRLGRDSLRFYSPTRFGSLTGRFGGNSDFFLKSLTYTEKFTQTLLHKGQCRKRHRRAMSERPCSAFLCHAWQQTASGWVQWLNWWWTEQNAPKEGFSGDRNKAILNFSCAPDRILHERWKTGLDKDSL